MPSASQPSAPHRKTQGHGLAVSGSQDHGLGEKSGFSVKHLRICEQFEQHICKVSKHPPKQEILG